MNTVTPERLRELVRRAFYEGWQAHEDQQSAIFETTREFAWRESSVAADLNSRRLYTVTFNTARLYTDEGQIITASYDQETNICRFVDHSRHVEGQFVTSLAHLPEGDVTMHLFARRVMSVYDAVGSWQHWIEGPRPERQKTVQQYRL